MKLGVNTVLFKGVDVKTAMKAIKLAGYDGVELSATETLTRGDVAQVLYRVSKLALEAPGMMVFRMQQ